MGSESNSPSSSSSPSGKRSRDPEDEVYVDNLHSHKRYLSEVLFLKSDKFPSFFKYFSGYVLVSGFCHEVLGFFNDPGN